MTMKDENQNVISQSNVNNAITFTGRRYDSESNLYYYRNRMYSPELGRFISKDPKGYVDGMNLYAYVKNNPLKYLDAYGTIATNINNFSGTVFENWQDNYTQSFTDDIGTGIVSYNFDGQHNNYNVTYDNGNIFGYTDSSGWGGDLAYNYQYESYDVAGYDAGGNYTEQLNYTAINMPQNNSLFPNSLEGAVMSAHIYNGSVGEDINGWTLSNVYEEDSLRMGVYSKTVNGEVGYTVANAGTYAQFDSWSNATRSFNSISEDIEQPIGGSEDMIGSLDYADFFANKIGDSQLTYVGHSKGGAEAAANALLTNRNAMVYNPAALNVSGYNLDQNSYTGNMTAYIADGEILDRFNRIIGATPIDQRVVLPNGSSTLGGHSIDTIIKSMIGN